MIKLYSARGCPYALRSRFALREKGVPYEHVEIDLKNKPADFLTLSPYGKVPLLLDGEARIYESAIINEFLDEKYPAPPLMPKEPEARAYVRIWIDFANTRLMPAMFRAFFGPEAGREEGLREALTHLEVLSRELGEREWFAGGALSLAEVTYSSALERLSTGSALDTTPNLKRWWERISARPAYQATGGLGGRG
jgi:glutathione S-transferase